MQTYSPCTIGGGSDAALEFEVQHRLIHAIPDGDIELWKEILKVSQDKGVSHLLETCLHSMPSSLALLQCAIDLKSNHRSIPHSARIAHASTHLGMTIALPESLSAKVV